MIESLPITNLPIIIFAKDKNSKYLFCNEVAAESAGLDSPQQIVGKTDDDLYWRQYAELYRSYDRALLRGTTLINEQVPFTEPKNNVTLLLSSGTILMNKKDFAIGTVCHATNITGYSITKNNGYKDTEKNIFHLGAHFRNEYLTKREFAVFKYLLSGKSTEEIALILSRSVKTVQAQIKSIINKLQCSHKSEIVPTAIKCGLTYVLDEINFIKN